MQIIKPAYYDSFRCLASHCPDSCCRDWSVVVDEASAQRYRSLPGELGDRLRSAMVQEDGDTVLALCPDGRCPMWRDDGLCRIQAALGEEALCHTCQMFPRLRHDYGTFVELGLELSCPEAARLILDAKADTPVFTCAPGGDAPEYDGDVMEVLHRSRCEILAFLNSNDVPVGHALAVMLLYGYDVQAQIDGGQPALLDTSSALRQAASLAAEGSGADILSFLQNLEILTPAWKARLNAPMGSAWSEQLRAMARYFVLRYWYQAVSDYDLISRVKLTVISCLAVKALGGNIYETAQLFSKEIENNADNVDAILDGAYTSPAFADIRLLGLLLKE